MNDRPNDIDGAVEGTCEWLSQHQTYKDWTRRHRGLLWIKGKPGSGKSTLLKHVLRATEARPGIQNEIIILSFFFHGRGGELQRTPLGLFRSLLHQLLSQAPDAVSHVVDVFEQRRKSIGEVEMKWRWHVRELLDFFKSSLPKVLERRSVIVIIDALDEAGQECAVSLVDDFKRLMTTLPPTTSNFRICFSCRHYPILELDYGSVICLEYENGRDIAVFVQAQFSKSRVRTISAITNTITRGASGVFMWARFVAKRVLELERKGESLETIQEEIDCIPPDLDDIYTGLIQSMEQRKASRKLIQWVCLSTRPLSIDELRWAMAVDFDSLCKSLRQCQQSKNYASDNEAMERKITTLSCGLAEAVPTSETRVVQFIHQSVKDFFVNKGLSALLALEGDSVSSNMAVGLAHYSLSRICIRYLAMEEVVESAGKSWTYWPNVDRLYNPKSNIQEYKFPLLRYAVMFGMTHARESETKGVCQKDLLEYFRWPSKLLPQLWTRICWLRDGYSNHDEDANLVHVVSRYGLLGPLQVILQRAEEFMVDIDGGRVDIDTRDSRGRTPLSFAAEFGHMDVIELLLPTDKVDVNARDNFGQRPLSFAARNGRTNVVKLLLATGRVDVDARDNLGRTPLSVDVDARDNSDWTPVAWAARRHKYLMSGCEDAIKLIRSHR
ncbi:hypothetical protein BGZ63DRAFT_416787 [Mariannaea sp. PMI_226]|nr:hypothetical protein BGZ63DRAFT_416787 [Mariannaea sp. PMI_226]